MNIERIVVVTRRTVLEELIVRFQTRDQARFYLTRSGEDFSDIERRHEIYHQALRHVRRALPASLKHHVIEGHGTLAGGPDIRPVTMAEARLSDGQTLLAVNDLFVGAASHVSARYRLRYGERSEDQSSSGLIVSTGAGSTGWLRSVFTGSAAMAAALGVVVSEPWRAQPWDADQLMFAVREPFPSRTTSASIVCGPIGPGAPFEVTSMMPSNGVIFSDGVEADFLEFNSGARVRIGIAPRKALLSI